MIITSRTLTSQSHFANLGETLDLLPIQPIEASLLVCHHLWRKSVKGYLLWSYIPQFSCHMLSFCCDCSCEKYKGEMVALCKLSNIRHVGGCGYGRVSVDNKHAKVCE